MCFTKLNTKNALLSIRLYIEQGLRWNRVVRRFGFRPKVDIHGMMKKLGFAVQTAI
jgi:hypothetical protein